MQMSARVLGREYGLTAQEMNRVLVKSGFLDGKPGDYRVTEKGVEFAKETDCHRGTGGSVQYNRYWTERTFDDSIKELLDITPELISEIRQEMSDERVAKKEQKEMEEADYSEETNPSEGILVNVSSMGSQKDTLEIAKKAGLVGLVVGGGIVVCYGVYKAVPKVKRWWKQRKLKAVSREV